MIGGVIGSGIFLTTGVMAKALPSPSLLLLAWLAGGLFALAGALSYAEMGAMFPRSGGVYVFLREAFGPLTAFLYGWACLLVVLSGGIAAVSVGFADYLSYFFPALPVRVSAVTSIVLLGGINYLGVRSGSGTNAVLTAAKLAGLAMLPLFALAAGRAAPAFTPIVPATLASPWSAFGLAMIAVLWANDGFYFLTYATGEIRDPTRTLPRALTIGLLSVTVVYLIVNVAYLFALPMPQLAGTTRVAERAAAAMVGPRGATLVALTVVVSTFGCNAAAILVSSRLLYAMASDGLFFKSTAAIHPRYRSPHVAVVCITAWSALLALSGSYEQLFTYVVFTSVLFSLMGGLALFRLRSAKPSLDRPYRVWGYPVLPLLFVLVSTAVLINTVQAKPFESIAGLLLLVVGLPVYLVWKRDFG